MKERFMLNNFIDFFVYILHLIKIYDVKRELQDNIVS